VADGKIHLHKVNGVKIAVPITKMSPPDLAYVEKVTNESIEDHIPVADLIKMKRRSQGGEQNSKTRSGASIDPSQSKVNDYDWFDFFLQAGVGPHQCDRYAQAMVRDSMDETVLPDITTDTLRTLGLKEGDALKVMKHLDQRFGRTKMASTNGAGEGGLFSSGPDGVLHPRRGRPESNRHTGDVVDKDALFKSSEERRSEPEAKVTSSTQAPARQPTIGFEDDAWSVKPSKSPAPAPQATTPAPVMKQPTGAIADLNSLLDTPLVPTPAQPSAPPLQQQSTSQAQPQHQPQQAAAATSPQTQQPVANPQFFSVLTQPGQIQPQATGPNQQYNAPRQRPQAPQQNFTGLIAPPPRPASAPQNPHQNQFGLQPLQQQSTGIPRTSVPQAPAGQSLNDLNQQRLQQQYQQMSLQAQPTAFGQANQGYGQFGVMPQPTGFQPQQFGSFQQQPYLNGNATGSPFADPRSSFQPQPTGMQFQQSPAVSGINSMLPPALQPQPTGYQTPIQQTHTNGFGQLHPQPTGYQQPMAPQATGFGQMSQQNGFGNFQPPPIPQIPQISTPAPLIPQKTGPAPPVKFGVTEAKKLTPQPTGRRANLANASKYNYGSKCTMAILLTTYHSGVKPLWVLNGRHRVSCSHEQATRCGRLG
jgi:hypothetical protein